MFKEIDLCGIFIAPIFGCLVVAGILFIPLSGYFDQCEIQKRVAHRPIFDAAVFVILFGVIFFLVQAI